MNSEIAHKIKHRQYANDEFMTPPELALELVRLVPLRYGDIVLDPCPGKGAFYDAFPEATRRAMVEGDFFEWPGGADWVVGNPPYSRLDEWLKHSFELANVGVAYLLGVLNCTPRRLELANSYGFGLTHEHRCKVFHWYGISAFCVWEKGKPDIITYDRTVWR